MRNYRMTVGANKIIQTCAKVIAGDQVLIITEPDKLSIAEYLADAVCGVGAEPTLMVMIPRTKDGEEPPENIAAAMAASDVFLCVVNKSITHTYATKGAVAAGARGLVLTQFNEEMLIKGGINVDFKKASVVCKAMANALAGAEKIHLTTTMGTDLTYSATGRRGNALYGIVEKGEFSTIPTIEANVSPLECTAQGKIVADASVPYIGIGVLDEPVYCTVKDGMITDMTGGKQAMTLLKDLESKNDPAVFNIAEMGIGLNRECRFIGFMLEDEGVYGSVHIGIGTSITLGGTVKAACHYDLIMTGATLVVDGKTLIKDGDVVYEGLGIEDPYPVV